MLAHSLLSSLHQQRTFLAQRQRLQQQQQQAATVDPALQRAQHMACDILNITESDLQDLMSTNGDAANESTCSVGAGDIRHCTKKKYPPGIHHARHF